jgi:hypothetical protein
MARTIAIHPTSGNVSALTTRLWRSGRSQRSRAAGVATRRARVTTPLATRHGAARKARTECWSMCTDARSSASPSRGERSAAATDAIPTRKKAVRLRCQGFAGCRRSTVRTAAR